MIDVVNSYFKITPEKSHNPAFFPQRTLQNACEFPIITPIARPNCPRELDVCTSPWSSQPACLAATTGDRSINACALSIIQQCCCVQSILHVHAHSCQTNAAAWLCCYCAKAIAVLSVCVVIVEPVEVSASCPCC